ncbi:ABC transporter transmembrane domain-containing protein [Ileibacterium valens]|uniref:ABC transporter transmembrane domain-containing protein n=1 Tax=Ileibacterium valens TaxID=1862668 RepID=UPI00272B9A77|nr:ABC transporter transmembrane domain-containing protein [Ileibacterium valens]
MFSLLKAAPLSVKQVVALLIFRLMSSFASMFMPTLLAWMLDSGVPSQNHQIIIILGVVMAMFVLMSAIFSMGTARLSAKLSTDFARRLRNAVFKKFRVFHPQKQIVFQRQAFWFGVPLTLQPFRCL